MAPGVLKLFATLKIQYIYNVSDIHIICEIKIIHTEHAKNVSKDD